MALQSGFLIGKKIIGKHLLKSPWKIGSPIKGATLIGDGPSILKEVTMVGNDMKLDPGIGTCGKAGQGVPVGVAQPSILINKMTVGGTKL